MRDVIPLTGYHDTHLDQQVKTSARDKLRIEYQQQVVVASPQWAQLRPVLTIQRQKRNPHNYPRLPGRTREEHDPSEVGGGVATSFETVGNLGGRDHT